MISTGSAGYWRSQERRGSKLSLSADNLSCLLTECGSTVAIAESCTGGMIGSHLTDLPGASKFFLGSAVTYSNESKEDILKVSHETLVKYGAVSEQTAKEMAEGVIALYKADYSISVTGIAGPDGGSQEKPVGLVYMAVSDGKRTHVQRMVFSGDRERIRNSTADTACEMLISFIEGSP